ncbi:MAG TPA: hypothetical protein VIM86_02015 [Thermodesulfobacteriota bacterium]
MAGPAERGRQAVCRRIWSWAAAALELAAPGAATKLNPPLGADRDVADFVVVPAVPWGRAAVAALSRV